MRVGISSASGSCNARSFIIVLLTVLAAFLALATDSRAGYTYVGGWGSLGSENGQFFNPFGIDVDKSGNVYIADYGNERIQKFSSSGIFITKWGPFNSFDSILDVAVDSLGNFYVAGGVFGIYKYNFSGKYITKWVSYEMENDEFENSAAGVAVDPTGHFVYVIENWNNRIQKFMSSGKYITEWGSFGSANGQFYNPADVAVDSSGNVYVTDNDNHRIQKFSSKGKFITKWGSLGVANGQFKSPVGVDVDASGNVYVVDNGNHRIQKFSLRGKFITKWGSWGSANGQFNHPVDVVVDGSGNVYVTDSGNHRIQKFTEKQLIS